MKKIIAKYGKKSAVIVFMFFLLKGILWLVAIYFGFNIFSS